MNKIDLDFSIGYKHWLSKKECNGCGAGWNTKLVPDTIFGLSVTEACCPHDYDYIIGLNNEDKEVADRRFRNNMLRLIDADTNRYRNNWLVKKFMRRRAQTYYTFVKNFGGTAFWNGKND